MNARACTWLVCALGHVHVRSFRKCCIACTAGNALSKKSWPGMRASHANGNARVSRCDNGLSLVNGPTRGKNEERKPAGELYPAIAKGEV